MLEGLTFDKQLVVERVISTCNAERAERAARVRACWLLGCPFLSRFSHSSGSSGSVAFSSTWILRLRCHFSNDRSTSPRSRPAYRRAIPFGHRDKFVDDRVDRHTFRA